MPTIHPFVAQQHIGLKGFAFPSFPPIHPSAFPIAQLTFFSALLLHNTFPHCHHPPSAAHPMHFPSPSIRSPLHTPDFYNLPVILLAPNKCCAIYFPEHLQKRTIFAPMLAPLPNSFGFFHHSIVHSSISQQTQFPSRHHLPCSSVLRIFQQLFTPIHSFPSPPR